MIMLEIKRYTASWCRPCQFIAPIFNELQQEINDVNFITIDVDENKEEVKRKGIYSVPTVVFEKDGIQVEKIIGSASKQQILNIIKKYKEWT